MQGFRSADLFAALASLLPTLTGRGEDSSTPLRLDPYSVVGVEGRAGTHCSTHDAGRTTYLKTYNSPPVCQACE